MIVPIVVLTIISLSALLYNRQNPFGFHTIPKFVGVPTNPKPFTVSGNSFWVEAVVEAVSSAFKLRQQKREADKEQNRIRVQQKADLDLLEKQASMQKANTDQPGQPLQSFLAGSSKYMPLAIIGAIAAFGVVLLKRK